MESSTGASSCFKVEWKMLDCWKRAANSSDWYGTSPPTTYASCLLVPRSNRKSATSLRGGQWKPMFSKKGTASSRFPWNMMVPSFISSTSSNSSNTSGDGCSSEITTVALKLRAALFMDLQIS
ncbi:hypothetical protein PC116_g22881 [Phytophthora cactorum]|nr:hypothetical protein PC116_g22881 [Phytophthora cactorum]